MELIRSLVVFTIVFVILPYFPTLSLPGERVISVNANTEKANIPNKFWSEDNERKWSKRRSGQLMDDDDELSSWAQGSLSSSSSNSKSQGNYLNLVTFPNKSITCNDGTPAGYYIRKSPSNHHHNNLWIIFLEGGWYCFNEKSCQNRWLRLQTLMSSASWPQRKHVGGILSSDPQENPYWSNANHIFVPYCSSDSWSGTSSYKSSGSSFSFMGALIIDQLVQDLVEVEGLKADGSVVLSGSSAGGTGVMLNLDRVESLLESQFGIPERRRVRGISDSGWFLDKFPFPNGVGGGKADCNDVILCPPQISLRKGMSLWNARLPENCKNSYPDEPWACFFGYKIYSTLRGSLFVFQWLFDEAQMLVNNVPTPAQRKEEWDFAYKLGDELKKSLANVTSLMVPSCVSHTVLTHRDWKQVEVNSVSLPRALKCWESGGIVPESNFILTNNPSSPSLSLWEEDSESPSSQRQQVLGNEEGGSDDNFILTHTNTKSHAPNSELPESNYSSSRRHRRRHNNQRRRRRRRQRRKKLQILQDEHKLNESPSDLLEANPNNRRRHSRRNSQVRISSSSSHSDDRNRNRIKRRRGRQRRWFSLCGDSDQSGQRLIEKCSWPQCNKSCPKLLNPVTGEEVDFKDLLKSFGLDMGTMAKALGIDLATLNNMDHQVLLQMLTQHA